MVEENDRQVVAGHLPAAVGASGMRDQANVRIVLCLTPVHLLPVDAQALHALPQAVAIPRPAIDDPEIYLRARVLDAPTLQAQLHALVASPSRPRTWLLVGWSWMAVPQFRRSDARPESHPDPASAWLWTRRTSASEAHHRRVTEVVALNRIAGISKRSPLRIGAIVGYLEVEEILVQSERSQCLYMKVRVDNQRTVRAILSRAIEAELPVLLMVSVRSNVPRLGVTESRLRALSGPAVGEKSRSSR